MLVIDSLDSGAASTSVDSRWTRAVFLLHFAPLTWFIFVHIFIPNFKSIDDLAVSFPLTASL